MKNVPFTESKSWKPRFLQFLKKIQKTKNVNYKTRVGNPEYCIMFKEIFIVQYM